jgi:hypothetical protein
MSKNLIDVFIPSGYKPKKVEEEAAWILARHYQTIVYVLRPTMGYKQKTPDFRIHDDFYELKTPTSAKTEKIGWLINKAKNQAGIIVIDMRKTKILEKHMVKLCKDGLFHYKKVQRIVLIANKKKVLEIER